MFGTHTYGNSTSVYADAYVPGIHPSLLAPPDCIVLRCFRLRVAQGSPWYQSSASLIKQERIWYCFGLVQRMICSDTPLPFFSVCDEEVLLPPCQFDGDLIASRFGAPAPKTKSSTLV